MVTIRIWFGMAMATIILTCCCFTSYSQTANLISNPSFEGIDHHVWKFQQRQSLWDLTTIKPDQTSNNNPFITITKSRAHHGHQSLMLTSSSAKQQQSQDFTPLLLAAQFVSINKQNAKGFHIRYHHWYLGKSSCWKFIAYIRSV